MALCVMPRSQTITLHTVRGLHLTFKGPLYDAEIAIFCPTDFPFEGSQYQQWSDYKRVNLKLLMLTPKVVREIERSLLLWSKGRAALMNGRYHTKPMRMLTRLVDSGLEVIASYVLTILGGPIEPMEDWGNKRRRPYPVSFRLIKTMVSVSSGRRLERGTAHTAALGSHENYHATD